MAPRVLFHPASLVTLLTMRGEIISSPPPRALGKVGLGNRPGNKEEQMTDSGEDRGNGRKTHELGSLDIAMVCSLGGRHGRNTRNWFNSENISILEDGRYGSLQGLLCL